MRSRVLISGIGGASLGSEVLKCLVQANRYEIFGCDISPFAFGHYDAGFTETFLVERHRYVESVVTLCRRLGIRVIIPGGEEPLTLLNRDNDLLKTEGIVLAANSPEIIRTYTDKAATFTHLAALGFRTPITLQVDSIEQMGTVPNPCIVKPATGSGGSSFVFLASNSEDAALYASYLLRNGKDVLIQEYIPEDEGEFTVGVLSLPDGSMIGSIAMQRLFQNKLSVLVKTRSGLISTGNSQGLIDDFPKVRATAEDIARKIDSRGPLNIQGRVRNGEFIPFEINPRFSASTYLRALAGFNEIDRFLRYWEGTPDRTPPVIRPGYYLRSFSEVYVPLSRVAA